GRYGIPAALLRYEQVRVPRVHRVRAAVLDNVSDHHLADGAQQRSRDTAMPRHRSLRAQAWLFGYDAQRAVAPGETQRPDGGIGDQVALVTGAAQGIGAAVARALAGQGALVAAVDVNAAGVARLAGELTTRGLDARAYVADVRDTGAVEAAVAAVE